MRTTFYDRHGAARAYLDLIRETIYMYDGRPAAWIRGEFVYAFSGAFLGWLEDGMIRDRQGRVALFTTVAKGGPIKPVRQVRPVRGVRGVRPVRGVREIRPVRPVRVSAWSELDAEGFFGLA